MNTMNDHAMLARYWSELYASQLDKTGMASPAVMIVGHEADGFITAEMHENPIENLAWATGYMGYPCDAVYVSTAHSVQSLQGGKPKEAVVTWTHLIPTNESIVLVFVKQQENGAWKPLDVTDDYDESYFEPIHHCAHDYEQFEIDPEEADARRDTRKQVSDDSGIGYHSTFYPPSAFLAKARKRYKSSDDPTNV